MDIKDLRISCKKYKNFQHIYMLNGHNLDGDESIKSLYKYQSFERFFDNLQKNEFVFVNPDSWLDPYEKLYLDTDYSGLKFFQKNIRCLCVTETSAENEEASWNAYKHDNSFNDCSIMIRYKTQEVLKALEKYASENNADIYIGNCIYGLSVKEIKSLYSLPEYKDIFFGNGFSIEHYLSLMLLKRKAFEYEKEIRFFVYKNVNANLLKIKLRNYSKLISEIRFEPDNMNSSVKEVNKKRLEEFMQTKKNQIKVTDSRLYESIPPIVRV